MAQLKENPTLRDLQGYAKDFCEEKGFDKDTSLQDFLLFSEEVGELAKCIRNVEGIRVETAKDNNIELEEEFADVFHYLLNLANKYNIDLGEAFRMKADKNQKRVWKVKAD